MKIGSLTWRICVWSAWASSIPVTGWSRWMRTIFGSTAGTNGKSFLQSVLRVH